MIDGEGEAGEERDDNAASPWCTLPMSSDGPMDDGVTDPVLDLDLVDYCRGDEELVLDVDEVLRHLYRCQRISEFGTRSTFG